MKFIFPILTLLSPAAALFSAQAGEFDLTLRTAGHGQTEAATASKLTIVTTGTDSGYLTARAIDTGDVLWRHDLVGGRYQETTVETPRFAHVESSIFAITSSGSSSIIDERSGSHIHNGVVGKDGQAIVYASEESNTVVFARGKNLKIIDGVTLLTKCDDVELSDDVIAIGITRGEGDNFVVATSTSDGKTVKVVNVNRFSCEVGEASLLKSDRLISKNPTKSSLVYDENDDSLALFSLTDDDSHLLLHARLPATQFRQVDGVKANSFKTTSNGVVVDGRFVATSGEISQETEVFSRSSLHTFSQSSTAHNELIVGSSSFILTDMKDAAERITNVFTPSPNIAIVTTSSHKTSLYNLLSKKKEISSVWTHHESLSSTKSVLFFDPPPTNLFHTGEGEHTLPTFADRIALQLGGNNNGNDDFDTFGFRKVAVILTGKGLYSIDMKPTSDAPEVIFDHILSEGSTGHKIFKLNAREVLLLSSFEVSGGERVMGEFIEVKTGRVVRSIETEVEGGVDKVYSFDVGSSTGNVIAFHTKNDRVQVFNVNDEDVKNFVDFAKSGEGVFTHSVKSRGLDSFMVDVDREVSPGVFPTINVGAVAFDESEKIVSTHYPEREKIESPATILGDDSLLLKYLNPNMIVVITETKGEDLHLIEEEGSDSFYRLKNSVSGGGGKTPLGATEEPSIESTQYTPSSSNPVSSLLFVNLIDSISGSLLHRIALADAVNPAPKLSLPVVISENWIIYAYYNTKTKRQEISALTLYEGMVEKNSITPFKSIEQEKKFSSFTAAKPIVLKKSFTYPKNIIGLGVSKTRGGIAGKMILMGLTSGQVVGMDRRMLDPRRPIASPKMEEKMEGLMQYNSVLPFIAQTVVSYTQVVEGAVRMSCAETNLESTSLVLAWGGADLFFTRLTPSGSFDLLPTTFNKPVLILIMVGIAGLVFFVKRLGKNKTLKMMWA